MKQITQINLIIENVAIVLVFQGKCVCVCEKDSSVPFKGWSRIILKGFLTLMVDPEPFFWIEVNANIRKKINGEVSERLKKTRRKMKPSVNEWRRQY